MKQNMPQDHIAPVYAANGRFVSNGYVDRGPRRDWRSAGPSMHRPYKPGEYIPPEEDDADDDV